MARAALVAFVLLLTGGPLAEVSAQQRKVEQGKQRVGKSASKAASGKQIVSAKRLESIDYQWLLDRQETVFEFKERARHRVFGFAVNTNGDWLLVVPTRYFKYELASEGAMLWRASDRYACHGDENCHSLIGGIEPC